jgi:F0F1-type ATP synthase assembly protein I
MDENKQNDKPWSALGFAWELGYSIVIPIMIFALVGRILDKKMDTSPWLLLLGILISIVVTTVLVYQKTIKIIK